MRRHCLSSRRGGPISWPSATASNALRAMLPSALAGSSHFSWWLGALCDPSFRATEEALQSSHRSLLLLVRRMDQVHMAQSPSTRSEAMGHKEAASLSYFTIHAAAGCHPLSLAPRSPPSPKPPCLRRGGRCVTDRRPPRSPTNCARAPQASSPRQPPPVSLRSCLPERLSSLRGA
jgi:hypothetical protein